MGELSTFTDHDIFVALDCSKKFMFHMQHPICHENSYNLKKYALRALLLRQNYNEFIENFGTNEQITVYEKNRLRNILRLVEEEDAQFLNDHHFDISDYPYEYTHPYHLFNISVDPDGVFETKNNNVTLISNKFTTQGLVNSDRAIRDIGYMIEAYVLIKKGMPITGVLQNTIHDRPANEIPVIKDSVSSHKGMRLSSDRKYWTTVNAYVRQINSKGLEIVDHVKTLAEIAKNPYVSKYFIKINIDPFMEEMETILNAFQRIIISEPYKQPKHSKCSQCVFNEPCHNPAFPFIGYVNETS